MPEPIIKQVMASSVIVHEGQPAFAFQCHGEAEPTIFKFHYDNSMTAIAELSEMVDRLYFIEAKRRKR